MNFDLPIIFYSDQASQDGGLDNPIYGSSVQHSVEEGNFGAESGEAEA